MPSPSEDDIILKLLLRGQEEADIIAYLEHEGMLDEESIHRVQTKIYEMKAAQSFLPSKPPKAKIRIYGISLMLLGAFIVYYFRDAGSFGTNRYKPSGYAVLIIVAGAILTLLPSKGSEKL